MPPRWRQSHLGQLRNLGALWFILRRGRLGPLGAAVAAYELWQRLPREQRATLVRRARAGAQNIRSSVNNRSRPVRGSKTPD